jgi:alpha-tubulin suppressor-like RCC1 family protein
MEEDEGSDELIHQAGLSVFAFGSNKEGQINGEVSLDEDADYLDVSTKIEFFEDMNPSRVTAGPHTSGAITNDGTFYMWGRAMFGDDGRYPVTEIEPVQGIEGKVIAASIGPFHRLVVADLKATAPVVSWGQGMYGKAGFGDWADIEEPYPIESIDRKRFSQVAAGGNHSLALNEDGEVFSWGAGNCGQLGHLDIADQKVPKLVEALEDTPVRMIAAGNDFSAVVTKDGELYTFGINNAGQLGHDDYEDKWGPTLVPLKRPVKAVACGYYHMMCQTEGGELYSWGSGTSGKLGTGDCKSYAAPQLIQALRGDEVVSFSCGWSHSAAVNSRGVLYTWGYGKKGRLGGGNQSSSYAPLAVDSLKVKALQVACGAAHTLVLVDETTKVRH